MNMRHVISMACVLVGAVQSPGAPPDMSRTPVQSSLVSVGPEEPPRLQPDEDSLARAYEEKEFARRINHLASALNDFSLTYNTGHVIDVKKVRAVRKAWVELEKSGWFRAEEKR
jgi:hypothetical protein